MLNYSNLYTIWESPWGNWFGRIGGTNCNFFGQSESAAREWLKNKN